MSAGILSHARTSNAPHGVPRTVVVGSVVLVSCDPDRVAGDIPLHGLRLVVDGIDKLGASNPVRTSGPRRSRKESNHRARSSMWRRATSSRAWGHANGERRSRWGIWPGLQTLATSSLSAVNVSVAHLFRHHGHVSALDTRRNLRNTLARMADAIVRARALRLVSDNQPSVIVVAIVDVDVDGHTRDDACERLGPRTRPRFGTNVKVMSESPWVAWRLQRLETRMELCRRTPRRGSRPRVATARRRRPMPCGWSGRCELSWGPSTARFSGSPQQLGYGTESVRSWVRQADIDAGHAPGASTV
jgi:hypothetical protein